MDEDEELGEPPLAPAAPLDPAIAARLERRYGRRRFHRRGVIITVVVSALFVIAAVGVVTMSGILTPAKNVSGEEVGTVTGPRSTAIDWQLLAPAGHPAACALDAQDSDHIIVGWIIVKVPAANSSVGQRLHSVIRTTRPAVEAEVSTCWLR